jgi:hypothetical protein
MIIRMPMKIVRTAAPPNRTVLDILASEAFIFAVFTGNSLKVNCALIDAPGRKIATLVPSGKGSRPWSSER